MQICGCIVFGLLSAVLITAMIYAAFPWGVLVMIPVIILLIIRIRNRISGGR